MKLKIVCGIIIPSVIVILLAILGSLEIGFSVEEDFIDEVFVSDLFQNGQIADSVKIADIYIENDYLFGKRYELKELGACLIDEDGGLGPIEAGYVNYNSGDLSPVGELVRYGSSGKSVEVDAYGSKKISVYISPSYVFQAKNYSTLVEEYGRYDSLIIFQRESSIYGTGSYGCRNVNQDVIDEAVKIELEF
ncbi:MAG: hypothetical protein ABIG28_00300 [archaeon]